MDENDQTTNGGTEEMELEDEAIMPDGWTENNLSAATSENPLGIVLKENAKDVADAGGDSADSPEESTAEKKADSGESPEGSNTEQPGEAEEIADSSPEGKLDYEALYKAKEEEEKKAGYQHLVKQLMEDNGMPEIVARQTAEKEFGKAYPMPGEEAEEGKAASPADLGTQIRRIHALFPDAREMPEEVSRTVMDGEDAVSAYAAWRVRNSEKELAALRRENTLLKKNAENRARAVAVGVNGGETDQPKSDFEKGFDSEW